MIRNNPGRWVLPVRRLAAAFALVLVLGACSAAVACPSCKEALAAEEQGGGNLVRGFFWSILFMMSMPFSILGVFCGCMYLSVRRARAAQGGVEPLPPAAGATAAAPAAERAAGLGPAED